MSGKSNRRWAAGGGTWVGTAGVRHAQPYSTSAGRGCQVYNAQGRVIGHVTPDGWLEKHVDPAKHMLRKPAGWATDEGHLSLPIRGLRLLCPDGTRYEASLELFRRHGISIERGFGRQVVLPLGFWRVERPAQPSLF